MPHACGCPGGTFLSWEKVRGSTEKEDSKTEFPERFVQGEQRPLAFVTWALLVTQGPFGRPASALFFTLLRPFTSP